MLDTQMPINSQRDDEELCRTPEEELIKQQKADIKELAEALDELVVDFWGSTGKGGLYDKCRNLANKHLKGE